MGREEECVQFPAGLSEMGNMDGIPRRCKVTAVAAYWFTVRLDWRWASAAGRRKQHVAASRSFPHFETDEILEIYITNILSSGRFLQRATKRRGSVKRKPIPICEPRRAMSVYAFCRYRLHTLRPTPTVLSIGSRQSGFFPQRKTVQLQLSRTAQMTREESMNVRHGILS
jgi:hypothetical protein